jgi:aerotaxis receptor
MRMNLPVTQREFDYPAEHMLVSTTDTKGFITHCNRAFVAVSGYTYDELIGQNHNLIRHPDMPAAAFKDLWSSVGRGRSWTGMVKNRRADGDHYWVQANVTPIMENGKPRGYMSVRIKPSRQEIKAAEGLYAQMNDAQASGKLPLYLQGGQVHYKGVQGIAGRVRRMTLTSRLGLALGFMIALGMLPQWLDLQGVSGPGLTLGSLLFCAALVLIWFHKSFGAAIGEASRGFPDPQLAPDPGQPASRGGRRTGRDCEFHPVGGRNCGRRPRSLGAHRVAGQQPAADRCFPGGNLQYRQADGGHCRAGFGTKRHQHPCGHTGR